MSLSFLNMFTGSLSNFSFIQTIPGFVPETSKNQILVLLTQSLKTLVLSFIITSIYFGMIFLASGAQFLIHLIFKHFFPPLHVFRVFSFPTQRLLILLSCKLPSFNFSLGLFVFWLGNLCLRQDQGHETIFLSFFLGALLFYLSYEEP